MNTNQNQKDGKALVLWEAMQRHIRLTRGSLRGYTVAQKALLQIAVMYLLPSWQPDTTYPQGAIIRVAGKVYKALRETSESPVVVLTDGNGNALTTDNPWQVLIDHDVNDGNWAQLDMDNLPSASISEQMENLRTSLNQRCDNYESDMQSAFVRYGQYLQQAYDSKVEAIRVAYNNKVAEIDAQYSEALAEQKAINAAQQKQLQEVKAMMDEMRRYTFMVTDYDNSK